MAKTVTITIALGVIATISIPLFDEGIANDHVLTQISYLPNESRTTETRDEAEGRIRLRGLSRRQVSEAAGSAAPLNELELADIEPVETAPVQASQEDATVVAASREPEAEPVWRDMPKGPIRAVGPVFFPDREARPGLRVPGQPADR
ncbi:hypothetical protein [Notoacmeibacter ruber]|uniref:hypothetical protein n=1 Tax=Notoacmeibacter ruber TaxID=2670375 RepID=UPI0011C472F2|nr:hypothetical protein [Notoacmeibacter ruber]